MATEFEKRMARLDQEIEKGRSWAGRLKKIVKNAPLAGLLCLLGVEVLKIPVLGFLVLGAVAVTIGAAVGYFMNESSLNKKYQAQADMMAAVKTPEPEATPSLKAGLGNKFDKAATVEKLAADVEELKKEVRGQPVTLDKPKRH